MNPEIGLRMKRSNQMDERRKKKITILHIYIAINHKLLSINYINVKKEIRKYTDRPIKIRYKQSRQYRRRSKPIYTDLQDCHALVTYQSIAAIESILFGVPAFTLAPCAADPVADKDLSQLDNPTVQDRDKIHKWAHHLAYGQFHVNGLKDGTAWRILHA